MYGCAALAACVEVNDVEGQQIWWEQGLKGGGWGHGLAQWHVGKEAELGLLGDGGGGDDAGGVLREGGGGAWVGRWGSGVRGEGGGCSNCS